MYKRQIRNSAIKFLSEELPHSIFIEVSDYQETKQKLLIDATIYCKKESQKGIIIGQGGSMIKKIGTDARLAIINKFGLNVHLNLNVKVNKNWINNEKILKKYKY